VTTVLLATGSEPFSVTPRRCHAPDHLLARCRGWRLDRALADGVDPDGAVPLSLRARDLLSPHRRRRLASGLRKALAQARSPRRPFTAAVPVARRPLLGSADLAEELAARLEDGCPVEVRGVAQVAVLLGDGGSPLYVPRGAGQLRARLEAALEAL
jgi:hypothetical protein